MPFKSWLGDKHLPLILVFVFGCFYFLSFFHSFFFSRYKSSMYAYVHVYFNWIWTSWYALVFENGLVWPTWINTADCFSFNLLFKKQLKPQKLHRLGEKKINPWKHWTLNLRYRLPKVTHTVSFTVVTQKINLFKDLMPLTNKNFAKYSG